MKLVEKRKEKPFRESFPQDVRIPDPKVLNALRKKLR